MRTLLAIAAIALTGCQAMMYGTASDFTRVSLGMTKAEVVQAIGDPSTVRADAGSGEEHLIYRRMPQTLGWLPSNYDVTLKDGRVVRYGELAK